MGFSVLKPGQSWVKWDGSSLQHRIKRNSVGVLVRRSKKFNSMGIKFSYCETDGKWITRTLVSSMKSRNHWVSELSGDNVQTPVELKLLFFFIISKR